MDPQRLVDIRAGDSEQVESYGTGYLLSPRLVLTARHVTRRQATGRPWSCINVYVGLPSDGDAEYRRARIRWTHPGDRDVALLELDAAVDILGEVSWGRVGGTRLVPYNGMAFPRATQTKDGHRKSEQLDGSIPPLNGGRGVHNLYALNQTIAPGERMDGKQAWGGASGAAVFCGDRLVGVVIHDDDAFRNHRLHACPAYTFVTEPGFTRVLQEHGVVLPSQLPIVQIVEQAPTPSSSPVLAAPPAWLSALPTRPTSKIFVGRTAELQRAHSIASPGRIISVVGPEHTGKSAFIDRLITDQEFHRVLGDNRPWALLDLAIPGKSSPFPVSRELARKLDANLFQEEYDEDAGTKEHVIKRLLSNLQGATRGYDIVTVIDCARFGKDPVDLEEDLDEVLSNIAFRRSVVLLASETHLRADGGQQLRRLPPVGLGPLTPEEATELLAAALDENQVRSDARQIIDLANDSLVRRPGILLTGVDQYASLQVSPHNAEPTEVAVALLDACHLTITEVFKEAGCRLVDDSGTPGAMAPLIVWATTVGLRLPQDVLSASGVDPVAIQRLTAHGVLLEWPSSTGVPLYELSRATKKALLNMTLVALGVDKARRLKPAEAIALGPAAHDPDLMDSALKESALVLFDATRSYFEDEEDDEHRAALIYAAESTAGWVRARAENLLPQLCQAAGHVANTLDMEALILPVELTRYEEELGQETAAGPDSSRSSNSYAALYSAVSQLNVRMREPLTARAKAQFVEACEQAVEALCNSAPGIPSQMLRSIDNALYFGGRRYRCDADMLRVRAGAAEALSEDARQIAKGRVSRLAGTISWLLNIVELQLSGQQLSEARSGIGLSHDLLGLLPEPNTPGGEATQLGLHMRIARARARTADNETERLEALTQALNCGATALERCAPTPGLRQLWTRRFIEAAKHYALELRTDDERSAVVDLVMEALCGLNGPVPAWGLSVRLAVTRFLRAVHRHQADPALRLEGANAAMGLLLPYAEALSQTEGGAPDGLLELARSAKFKAWALEENERLREAVAEARNAERYALLVVESAPSASAYRVWLECLRYREQIEAGDPEDPAVRAGVRRAVDRAAKWLATQEARTEQHAQLARLCIVEEWRLRGGSLLRAAVEANNGNPNIRLDVLTRVYAYRVRTLGGHEKRYGPTIGTALLRYDLEREYQRLLVVNRPGSGRTGRRVNNHAAWDVLDQAERLWPHSTEIQLARAGLHRYTWEYSKAATLLESVIRSTHSGQKRRQAQIDTADLLLRYVRWESPTPSERTAALERAAAHLIEPLTHRFQSERVAVLHERVRLEAGALVDQQRIDTAFEELIGLDYSTSIGRYLHRRRYAPTEPTAQDWGRELDDTPQELTQLLYDNFTDIDLINGLGQLYLRQSELWGVEGEPDRQHEATVAAQRAFDCFDACRVLLDARDRKEDLVNCFQRAEAIWRVCQLAGTANPLPWKPENKPSWLKLAVDLFQSAAGRSVGTFHLVCVDRIGKAQRLLNQLTG
nr:hypothetical protein KitaXyl93_77150 [Kitasatospora sp. Xyl93]